MDITQIFTSLWFTDKEAEVYLVLLQSGKTTVTKVARIVQLHRVTTYSLLKKLVEKGFVTEVLEHKLTRYQAVSLELLQQKMEITYNNFVEAMPQLLAMENDFHKTSVEYFRWYAGLRSLYEDVLLVWTDIFTFMGVDYINQKFKKYIDEEFIPARVCYNYCTQNPRNDAI